MQHKHTHITVREIGNTVICDVCGEDYTNSDERGGFLFGTYAYCPKCATRCMSDILRYGETDRIKAKCPLGMTYRDWVLKLRGGDNTITTWAFGDEP
jgi:hypothetical protein